MILYITGIKIQTWFSDERLEYDSDTERNKCQNDIYGVGTEAKTHQISFEKK
jgi:hypothetical protein